MSVMLEVFAVGERGRDTFSLALSGIFIHSLVYISSGRGTVRFARDGVFASLDTFVVRREENHPYYD